MSKKLNRLVLIVGILLIAAALCLLIFSRTGQKNAADEAAALVAQIRELLPQVQDSIPDERADNAMPMLEINGKNLIGILEVPAYQAQLPLGAEWDVSEVASFPCRYMGSVYENSLIVGGSDNEGQLDFMQTITGGDIVKITDVTGRRYTYVVTRIEKTSDVSTENLRTDEADLTLFARNSYGWDYTVVRCDLQNKSY